MATFGIRSLAENGYKPVLAANMDLINSLFVFGGVLFTWLNVFRIWKDGVCHGVSVWSQAFFALWATWTVVYFISNGHIISSCMAVIQAIGGIVWVVLYLRYKISRIID